METLKSFECFEHHTNQIELQKHLPENAELIAELKPVQIHHKSDGTIDNKPSFCIVLTDDHNHFICGQISLDMLNTGLKEIGYEVHRIQAS